MKWSVVILILLGLGAALSMALLTASLAAKVKNVGRAKPEPPIPVLLAGRKLEPMTVVDQSMVSVKMLPREQAPANHYSDPVQVTGRMVAVPVIEGQALSQGCFAPEGAGFELAAKLPPGMRAISVSLSYPSAMKGFLYPGSIVDVLAAFKFQPGAAAPPGEAVSTTLLESIQILAVDDRTVAQPTKQAGMDPASAAGKQQSLVTLKVDPRQAEALQLASEYGTVSLAMRNPADAQPLEQGAMLLSQGKLGRMADMMSAMVAAAASNEVKKEEPSHSVAEVSFVDVNAEDKKVEPAPEPAPPEWEVTLYRGLAKQEISLPLK